MAELDPAVKQLLDETKPGRDAHDQRTKKYDTSYHVYRNSAPDAPSVKGWQSRLRVPYGQQVIDICLVNIIGGPPRIKVLPRLPEFEQSAKKMQVALDYYIAQDEFAAKQHLFVQQGLIYGVTVAKNHWLYEEQKRSAYRWIPHPFKPGEHLRTKQTAMVVTKDGPTFEPWNVYDAWWDPNGRDVDNCEYIVLRSWLSREQLERRKFDPETGVGYQNLDLLWKTGHQKRQASVQERATGSQDALRKNCYEIWECWYDDRYTVIGNQEIQLIPLTGTPFWHGKKPAVISQVRPDGFNLQGIAETELINDLQQAMGTLQNARIDNLHMTVMRGFTYREGGVTDPNALELRPRFKWPVMDHDDIRPVDMQPLSSDVYREDDKLLAQMQLVTGINPYISGADSAGVDQNTATGITALQEVASRLLRFKARMIMYQGYQPSFRQWGQMVQQFLDHEMDVRVEGQGADFKWEKLGPQDVAGDYDYVLEGTEESLSRQQERGEAIALLNALAPFVQMGVIDPAPLVERVADAYGFTNPKALIKQMSGPPSAFPQPPQNGQPPPQLLGGQQLPPQVAQAIGNR